MNEKEKKRVCWACRRGMKELDLLLIPYYETHFAQQNSTRQSLFAELLETPDPLLYAWLMDNVNCEKKFSALVEEIKKHAKTQSYF